MLFHTPDGVGAMSEGEIDPVPAGPAGDAGDPLGPAPAQPARPTVKRVSSAAPARRIRIRVDFVFMPYPNWSALEAPGPNSHCAAQMDAVQDTAPIELRRARASL